MRQEELPYIWKPCRSITETVGLGRRSATKPRPAKDKYGFTACHLAADEGNLETLDLILGWAEEV